MKKFLFTTLFSNDLGLLSRSLPIADELRGRGHRVAFCNPQKAPTKVLSDAGFDNLDPGWPLLHLRAGNVSLPLMLRLVSSRDGRRDVRLLTAFVKQMNRFGTPEVWTFDHFMYLFIPNESYARAEVRHLIDLINQFDPDAVVDFWNPSACIAARATHKPLITVIQADMHPQSRGFIWWREPPAGVPTPTPFINRILAELGLKPVGKTAELLVGDRTLVLGMPEVDPLPKTAEATHIGPVLWQKPEEKLPDWVTALDTTKPLIWIYPGNPGYAPGSRHTPFDSNAITHACIEALRNMDAHVVLSTGHQPLPKDATLPANFRHSPFLPGLAMAQRSDLVIHHGGYGSCQTGLVTGTPALVIPTYSERESNARRVAAAGAGEFVLPSADPSGQKKRVDAAEVREKVDRILSDASYKESAARISRELQSYGGAPYAASLIEELSCSGSTAAISPDSPLRM